MDERESRIHLLHVDQAWEHAWEALYPLLRDVAEEEARWRPANYTEAAEEAGGALPGSIAWHVEHLASCKRSYAATFRGEDGKAALGILPAASFADSLEALRSAHAALRASIAGLGDRPGDDALSPHVTVEGFIAAVTRHDVWHGGQIAMLRRMYRDHRASLTG